VGAALAKRFGPGVEVVNLARSGASSKNYRTIGQWKKALDAKPVWVLIQFGNNDQPGKGPDRETDPKSASATI
jgi:lysophospholipase L1-like esterase